MADSANTIKKSEPGCGCSPSGSVGGWCDEMRRLDMAMLDTARRYADAEKAFWQARDEHIAAKAAHRRHIVDRNMAYRAHVEASNG